MESENKKDSEWKFDVDGICVRNFKELVGLIVISRIVPNLNSKLDDNERKFVEACYNGFGFEENYNWAQVIKEHKENRELSLTGNIYHRVSSEFAKIPFEKLSEIMKGNNFTWDKIFDMIKKLDAYCYIYFANDFFDFKDLAFELKEKLKSELGKVFNKFKEDWKQDRQTTIINNRKNWIKKVKLEEKKIIKSREDLNEIFTKIKECLDDRLFLYSNEDDIIRYELRYNCFEVFRFLWEYRDDEDYSNMEDRKLVLELLVDLGFSFDYEKFIGNKNTFGEVVKAESKASRYIERDIWEPFKKLVRSFNQWRDFDKSILWFDDKNKKIDVSMLGFNLWSDEIEPIDKQYDRGFSERNMSYVLDKFKNEENGFCHDQNIQFFVYMMNNPCKDELRIMKDEKKREQFYLDLMDVIAKSVGVASIPINKIFNCETRDFTEEEEEDFIKENNLQGIEEKTKNTLIFMGYTEKCKKLYLKNEKKQKITLIKVENTGYFLDIIRRIPNDVLDKKEVKQKIKEVLEQMYNKADNDEKKTILNLILFIYRTCSLDLSKEDIQKLLNYLSYLGIFGNTDSYWFPSMFDIIFKNRDKFSLDEKKKLLDEVMKAKIKSFGWSFSEEEKELKDSNSELNQKIKKIQGAVKKWRNKKVKIQKVFRGFSHRKKLNLKERKDKTIKLQAAVRKFLAKRKLEKLKLRKEKLKSLVQKKPETQEKIKKVILTNKLRRYLDQVKKLKLNATKEKHSMIKITRVAKQFLTRKRKKLEKLKLRKEKLKSLVQKTQTHIDKIEKAIYLKCYSDQVKKLKRQKQILNSLIEKKHNKIKQTETKYLNRYSEIVKKITKMTNICKWLFAGFVISLVIFLFWMLVLKFAFLSVLPISTLAIAIILTIAFLYIDHKFKIFFWKRKPPIQMITESPIEIGSVPLNQNLITDQINTNENDQNLNQKPAGAENIINTSENNQKQINLNEENI